MNRYPEILVTLKEHGAVDEKTGAVDVFKCPVEIIYQLAYSILRKDHEEILKKYIVLFENNHEITKQSLENTRIAEDKKRLREDISRLEKKIQEKNEIIESFKRSKTERLNQTRKEVNADIVGALKHYEIDNERLEKDLFECMNKIFRRTIEDINKETT